MFFPYQDLHIDISGMDLSDHRNRVNLQRISLCGQINYMASEEDPGSLITWSLDESLSYVKYSEEGAYENSGFLPPMHAILSWMYTDFFEGNDEDGTWEAVDPELVFHDSEEDIPTYHPFVERGKKWCVHGFSMGGDHTVTDYYFSEEEILFERNGHFYEQLRTRTQDGKDELVGWFREENQRVYIYNETEDKEVLTYDFSLEEGDRFSPEYGDYSQCEVKEVSYKEINGERLKVITFEANDRNTDARTEVEWIEGIGSLSWPLAGLYSGNPNSWSYNLAYVLYDNPFEGNYYLPLTFVTHYAGWWGQQPQIDRQPTLEGDSQFQYELVPDPEHDCYTLHVYGDTVWSNSPNRYAYCVADKSSSTFKVSIKYEELEPYVDGIGRYHVDINFPFFLSELPNVAVDQFGEHPISVRQEPQADYRPFIEEGKVWHTVVMGQGDNHNRYEYWFQGDTIVGGQKCKIMNRSELSYDIDPSCPAAVDTTFMGVLYEKDGKVYYAAPDQSDFSLLYDFSAPIGTAFKMRGDVVTIIKKERQQDAVFKGEKTYVQRKSLGLFTCWLEAVGYSSSPINNINGECATGEEDLISCMVGDEVLYYDEEMVHAITGTDNPEVKKKWLDFTHTVKTRPKAPERGVKSEKSDDDLVANSEEETVTGEYSVKALFVNFTTLAGPYAITITDAAGQEVYRKVVQTSNVVALNTDISAYPKGSYTLTVENEEEVYAALLNINDENSLSPTLSPVKQGSIYNLKGQRLTKPQRGVNIINGRKVVVK